MCPLLSLLKTSVCRRRAARSSQRRQRSRQKPTMSSFSSSRDRRPAGRQRRSDCSPPAESGNSSDRAKRRWCPAGDSAPAPPAGRCGPGRCECCPEPPAADWQYWGTPGRAAPLFVVKRRRHSPPPGLVCAAAPEFPVVNSPAGPSRNYSIKEQVDYNKNLSKIQENCRSVKKITQVTFQFQKSGV